MIGLVGHGAIAPGAVALVAAVRTVVVAVTDLAHLHALVDALALELVGERAVGARFRLDA